jgi:TonB-dependent receptor
VVKLHNIFLGSVSVLAVSAIVGPAIAQSTTDSTGVETVVVTGIRGSLKSAQTIKQNSDVFQDSITAEDIGALPDRSVVESIQRIPGVAINKFLASNDPDHFSAEGSGVVVRGLTYVRSEFNGRDTFSANNGRELGFADVPSEMLIGVDVFKSPSADMVEGGISGTVNLRTRVPFDAEGRLIAGTLEGSWGDFRHRITPTVSVLASDRWSTPAGEFGILGNFIYSQTDTRSDNAQADYFVCRTDLGVTTDTCPPGSSAASGPAGSHGAWFPSGANISRQDFVRKRVGYATAGQWQSNDGAWLATLQFVESDTHETWDEKRIEIASDVVNQNGSAGPLPVGGTTFDFGSDGVFTDGVITGQTGWRADGNYDWLGTPPGPPGGTHCNDSPCDPRTPYWGLQSNNHNRDTDGRYVTADYGANLKFTPDDTWAFNLDLQHIESATHYLDAEINSSTYQSVAMDLRGDLPKIQFLPPGAPASAPFGVDHCLPGGGPGIEPRPQPNHGATFDAATTCNTFMGYGHTSFADPYNTFWRSAMDHYEHSDGIEDSMRFDVDYHVHDMPWLQLIRAGYRWAERDQTTRSTVYN